MDRTHSMIWAPRLPVPWEAVEQAWRMVRIAVVFAILVHLIDERVPDCGTAVKRSSLDAALSVCRGEFAETHDPATGVRVAELLRGHHERVAARGLAGALIGSSAQPGALGVLANLARDERRHDEAVVLLAAVRQRRAPDDHHSRAYDAQITGAIEIERQRYGAALRSYAECLRQARYPEARDLEFSCHLGAVDALRRSGSWDLARRELDAAKRVMPDFDYERLNLAHQEGNLEQEFGIAGRASHDLRAIEAFRSAARYNEHEHNARLALSIEVNLADLQTSVGELDEAEAHLALANTLDADHDYVRDHALIAARLALARGDHPRARAFAAYADEAFDDTRLDPGDREDLAVIRVRIALAEHDGPSAEAWSEIAVACAERVRAQEPVLELRPAILARLRLAYELRFVALARAGRAEDALLALDRWQGRTMLDALATPAAVDLEAAARGVDALATWLPVATEAGFAAAPDPERIRAALRRLDFVALVVADGDVWRLTALHGKLAARDLGPLAALAPALERFTLHPEDVEVAAALGERLLDPGAVRRTGEALHVLLDGPLAALPIAALRSAGDTLIGARPVLQVLRVPDVPCVDVDPIAHATIFADAHGDLPAAAAEAGTLATDLPVGATVLHASTATSTALLATAPGELLHLAIHARVGDDGGALVLHDRAVPALELAARRLHTPLVVLSVCDAAQAAALDTEHFSSLVSAFLAGGTPQVIATTRVVTDAGARDLATKLYRHGALSDPVRALRAVQLERAAAHNLDWPRFAAFGHDRCSFMP